MSVFFSAHYHRGIESPQVSVYLGDFGPSLKLSTVNADVTICGDDVAHLRGILAAALDALDKAQAERNAPIENDPFIGTSSAAEIEAVPARDLPDMVDPLNERR